MKFIIKYYIKDDVPTDIKNRIGYASCIFKTQCGNANWLITSDKYKAERLNLKRARRMIQLHNHANSNCTLITIETLKYV